MGALARPSDIQRSFLSGAGGGTRTHTSVTPTDFEFSNSFGFQRNPTDF